MNRWVSLSSDANPHYAIYAPIVTRIWQTLGFKVILFVHNAGWESPLGQFVRANLPDDIVIIETPRLDPQSVGNTMRMVRLAASACAMIEQTDIVMTADIDMAPLDRTWWTQYGGPAFILRADMYGPFEGATTLLDGDKGRACQSGLFRFPLCYVGLARDIWRDITPYRPSVEGDPIALARLILHGCRADAHDYDEAFTSARLLLSRWATGSLRQLSDGSWQQGELRLVPMTDWPGGWPNRMLLGGQAAQNGPPIDFHMPKPSNRYTGGVLGQYWPEQGKFLEGYWLKALELAGFTG